VARKHGWTTVVALLVGLLGASLFWLYGPYLDRIVALRVGEALKTQSLSVEVGKGGPTGFHGAPAQARGANYQIITDGKQVFLADLKEGRVWRYFHQTKEGGSGREEEGFLPLALYYGGKKYFSAQEVEALMSKPPETPVVKPPETPPAKPAEKPQAKPGEKKR
jgi:hypothetical protein